MGLNVVINPDYQEEIGLIIYEGGKKDYFGLESGDSLGHSLVLPCLMIKAIVN